MELVRNKASGKYFIVLDDDIRDINFQLITPEGKVRPIERRLFGVLDIIDPKKSLWRHKLTELQLKKYEEYLSMSQ